MLGLRGLGTSSSAGTILSCAQLISISVMLISFWPINALCAFPVHLPTLPYSSRLTRRSPLKLKQCGALCACKKKARKRTPSWLPIRKDPCTLPTSSLVSRAGSLVNHIGHSLLVSVSTMMSSLSSVVCAVSVFRCKPACGVARPNGRNHQPLRNDGGAVPLNRPRPHPTLA